MKPFFTAKVADIDKILLAEKKLKMFDDLKTSEEIKICSWVSEVYLGTY